MYLIFIDGSGDPGDPARRKDNRGSSKCYTIVGLGVHDPYLVHLDNKIHEVYEKIIEPYRELMTILGPFKKKIKEPRKELKYSDVINKRGIFRYINRDELFNSMYGLIESAQALRIIIGAVTASEDYKHRIHEETEKQKGQGGPSGKIEREVLFRLIREFNSRLETIGELGLVFHDADRAGERIASLRQHYQELKSCQKVYDTLAFVDSEKSAPLWLADFCAYPVRSYHEKHGEKNLHYEKICSKIIFDIVFQ